MARISLTESKTPKPNTELGAHRASVNEGEAARRLLEEQGYIIKRVANGQIECRCPFHEGPGELEKRKGTNFYLNAETSVYYCQSASCGERGNLKTLERFFGVGQDESYAEQFFSREQKLRIFEGCLVESLRTPLKEHGLTDTTIERFRIGYEPEHTTESGTFIPGRYVIPYLEGRRPKLFRYYCPDTRERDEHGNVKDGQPEWEERYKYTWEKGAEATLFNAQDAMGDAEGRVFLTEGELKAMLLVQLGYAAVAVPGAGQWRSEWQAAFTHARRIYVCYDNDNPDFHIYDKPAEGRLCRTCIRRGRDRCAGHNPGQEAAQLRVVQLGWRAKNVVLPLPNENVSKTDINDFFMRDGHSNPEFAQLATGKSATPFKVKSFTEILADPPEEAEFLIEQGILPKAGRLLVAGKPKVGKAQPISTPVLTPTGWTAMGELRAGDQVIGADGQPAKVTHIHPQGRMPIYRVTMSDGSATECTAEHLWTVQTHNDRTAGNRGRTFTTTQIAELLAQGRPRSTYLPMTAPIQYAPQQDLPIDPYGLGILLVSAGLRGTPTVGTLELLPGLQQAFPQLDVHETAGGVIHLTGTSERHRNPLIDELRLLELYDTRTYERQIPLPYLTAPIQDRLRLLQGVMDGSGWVQVNAHGNTSAHVSTSGEAMKDGIVELVESLGGTCRVRLRAVSKYQLGVGRPSWLMTVRLPGDMEPFRLPSKLTRWQSGRTSKNAPPQRKVVAVDYIRDDEAQCITIDRADGLYITERFIVTHNSIFVDNMGLSLCSGMAFLSRFKIQDGKSGGLRTLLLDRELSKWSLFKRINDLTDAKPGYRVGLDNLLIDHDHLLRFDQPTAYDTLMKLVEDNGADVCILDTAYKFFAGDVESSSSLMKGFEVIDKVIHKTECAFVLTHHLRKGEKSKGKENNDVTDPDAVAGSFLWTGWPNATILLNYLNRSVENPYNAIATFTAFRDHAAPEPLALYRDRDSIAYTAIQPYSHDENAAGATRQAEGRPTTEAVATVMIDLCPNTEADILHQLAAHWGTTISAIRPFFIDAMASGHFQKTNGRPPVIKYKHAGPDLESWEHEHGLPEKREPEGLPDNVIDLFDAAGLRGDPS